MLFSSAHGLLRRLSSQNLHIGTIVWEKRDLRAHKLLDYASRKSDLINQKFMHSSVLKGVNLK